MNNNLLVLQSDFGLVDGAVSAMIGVALEESPTLKIHHLTHDITPYNILRGAIVSFRRWITGLRERLLYRLSIRVSAQNVRAWLPRLQKSIYCHARQWDAFFYQETRWYCSHS